MTAGALCGTRETYLDTFEGRGTAGRSQTWQKLNLYCIHDLDPSMTHVLVLAQISCDEEKPPFHKARAQTWINVSVAGVHTHSCFYKINHCYLIPLFGSDGEVITPF